MRFVAGYQTLTVQPLTLADDPEGRFKMTRVYAGFLDEALSFLRQRGIPATPDRVADFLAVRTWAKRSPAWYRAAFPLGWMRLARFETEATLETLG